MKHPAPRFISCLIPAALLLAACARPPVLGAGSAVGPGPWPPLAPLSDIKAAAAAVPDEAKLGKTAQSVAARAAALRARAAQLGGPVVDPETLAKLEAALAKSRG